MNHKDFVITPEQLVRALSNKIGLKEDIALDVALRVMDYFGFGDTIIDNALNQEDRRLFYFLQDTGMMRTHWDETFLPSGRNWRIFYWRLNTSKIREYAQMEEETEETEMELYESLPDNAWCRQGVT
jgi:hypothetical protein